MTFTFGSQRLCLTIFGIRPLLCIPAAGHAAPEWAVMPETGNLDIKK